jgi:UDP-N-acetylglucosamine acyltransferase
MSPITLDTKEIEKIIPHRYPFLLIDRITIIEEGKKAVAIKNITANEPQFTGHFPGNPIMPGVLIMEALAQTGAVLALRTPEGKGKLVLFAGIDGARFKRIVLPGDQLTLEADVLWFKKGVGKMKGVAKVGDQIAAEAELMFAMADAKGATPNVHASAKVHPTAVIDPSAKIGKNVELAAYSVIGPEVEIGDDTKIGEHTVIHRWTKIGKGNNIFPNCSIGAAPQDIRYKGEKGEIIIGDNNTIREFVTIHLPEGENKQTIIGNNNFIMVHAHIPHNAKIGNFVVIGGYCGIAGFVQIDDYAVIGGMAGIHQFVRIGKMVMVGAHSKVVQDIPNFMLAEGDPAQVRTINAIGLSRRGVSTDAISEIKKAFKILYGSKMNLSQALEEIKHKVRQIDEIKQLLAFLETDSRRGISKKPLETEGSEDDLLFPDLPELGI